MINEAIDKGDHSCTLQSLQVEAAKLSGITPDNSQLYQKVLFGQKTAKAEVREEIRNLCHENNLLLNDHARHSVHTHATSEV